MEHYKNQILFWTPLLPELIDISIKYIGWDIGESIHFVVPMTSSPDVQRIQLGRVASFCIDRAKGTIERLLVRYKNTVKYSFAFDDLIWISPTDVVPITSR